MQTLRKTLENIGFFEREKRNEKYASNKCGRDFLYYALNYLKPEVFNSQKNNPIEIDRQKLFGPPMPAYLAWTQIQFSDLGACLEKNGLSLTINERSITNYHSFVKAILFSRCNYKSGLQKIERAVDENRPVGVDISLGIGGLLDHVLFVYGYDVENLYVIDTHRVSSLEYEPVYHDNSFYFRLPKEVVEKRWTRFGRVWEVHKLIV